jgi:hypothetical protein
MQNVRVAGAEPLATLPILPVGVRLIARLFPKCLDFTGEELLRVADNRRHV